eukprot:SAG22_NODE_5973_length_923_cov_1.496359_1_plen_93_part_10
MADEGPANVVRSLRFSPCQLRLPQQPKSRRRGRKWTLPLNSLRTLPLKANLCCALQSDRNLGHIFRKAGFAALSLTHHTRYEVVKRSQIRAGA